MFEITEEISELISADTPVSEIRSAAAAQGFKSMKDSGFEKIKNGITNYEEVMREILL
jgi:type II secretory ATPase GspE/PulE/Tfp pilus assembly ATPase PilB-like protein